MNDSIIALARVRHDEIMRRANRDRLARRVRGATAGTKRTSRTADGTFAPVIRLATAAARMRPTATGR